MINVAIIEMVTLDTFRKTGGLAKVGIFRPGPVSELHNLLKLLDAENVLYILRLTFHDFLDGCISIRAVPELLCRVVKCPNVGEYHPLTGCRLESLSVSIASFRKVCYPVMPDLIRHPVPPKAGLQTLDSRFHRDDIIRTSYLQFSTGC